jgi:hypothetical protein
MILDTFVIRIRSIYAPIDIHAHIVGVESGMNRLANEGVRAIVALGDWVRIARDEVGDNDRRILVL